MNGHRSLRFFTRALCWTPVLGFVLVGGCRDQEVTGPRAGETPPPTDRTLAVAHVALEVDPASGAVRVLPQERARDRSGGPAFATVPVTGEHVAVQARCEGCGDQDLDNQVIVVTFTVGEFLLEEVDFVRTASGLVVTTCVNCEVGDVELSGVEPSPLPRESRPGDEFEVTLEIAALEPRPFGVRFDLVAAAVRPATVDSELDLELVAEGLASPVHLLEAPDGSGRLFVVDQPGQIRIIDASGALLPSPFLDISGRMVPLNTGGDERGLLGMAFHPDYAENGRFFVYYSAPLRTGAPSNFNHTSHVSEFQVGADANVADPTSERILLQIDQPQANHNAGMLAFGPHDGMLYISLGDGGGRDDDNPVGHVSDWYDANEGGNAQNVEANLLGKILRIDVDGGTPYGVPTDNPFVGGPGLDEIWAYGFRNPFRFSFDIGGDNDLLAGDAGQGRWEEVSLVIRGGNYGWNVKEGAHCFDAAAPDTDPPSCPAAVTSGIRAGDPLIDPVIEYAHASQGGLGRVVVGGYVYRGADLPLLQGRYVFGDYTTSFAAPTGDGLIFVATPRNLGPWQMQELSFPARPNGRLGLFLKGFGQDAGGEVYVLASSTPSPFGTEGVIFRLAPAGG